VLDVSSLLLPDRSGFCHRADTFIIPEEKTKREQMNSASLSVCECLPARNNCVFGIMLVFLDTHIVKVCTNESFVWECGFEWPLLEVWKVFVVTVVTLVV